MPNILSNPKFIALDFDQKRAALTDIFEKDPKWTDLNDEQREAVFEKLTGVSREQEYGEVRQGPSKAREMATDVFTGYMAPAIETAASVAGGVAGAGSPVPGGARIGGALAYGGAKGGTRGIERLLRGQGGHDIRDLARGTAGDIQEGMLGEIIPPVITGTAKKLMAPLAKKLGTTAARGTGGKMARVPTEAKTSLLNLARTSGIDLTPAEVTGSKTMALFESFLEKLPRSSDVIQDFRLKSQLEPLLTNLEDLKRTGATEESIEEVGTKIWNQVGDFLRKESTMSDDQLNMVRDRMTDVLGTKKPVSMVAEEAQEALVGKAAEAKKGVREKYEAVSEALPTEPIETPVLEEVSKEVLGEIEGLPAQSSVVKQVAKWAESGQDIPEDLLELIKTSPPEVRDQIIRDVGGQPGKTAKQLKGYVETLNSLIQKEDALGGLGGRAKQFTKEGAMFTKLKSGATKDLEKLAESAPETDVLLKGAKKAHAEYAKTYKDREIQKLLQAKPKDIIDRIIIKDNVQGVQQVRKAMGNKGFTKIKEGLTNKLMGVGKHDVFDPKYLKTQLSKYEDDVLNEVYGKDAVNGFKKIAADGIDLTKQKPGASFLKTIVNGFPETAVDAIIGTKGSKLTSKALYVNTNAIKKAISEKEFSALGDKLFDKIIDIDQHTKLVKPKTFAKTIETYGDRLKAFYPADKVDELQKLANISRDLAKAENIAGNASGTAQINIMWGIVDLFASLPVANIGKKAFILSTKKMADFYTSPAGRKFLTTGYKIPKTTEDAFKLGTKIATLSKIDLEEKEKK